MRSNLTKVFTGLIIWVVSGLSLMAGEPQSEIEAKICELEHEIAMIDHTDFFDVPKGDMRMPYGFFYTGALMEPILNKLDLVLDKDKFVPRVIKYGIYLPFGVGGLAVSHFVVHPTQVCYNKTKKCIAQWRLECLKREEAELESWDSFHTAEQFDLEFPYN